MCDLFALSASQDYTPREYLPIFAERGKRNVSGWGIGFFRDGRALVEKSSERVFVDDQVHESFQRLARVIDSRIIVSHISCPLNGGRHSSDNHPFSLDFLGHNWLFVHVGVIEGIGSHAGAHEPKIESGAFPARIFEFLRDRLVETQAMNPYLSFCEALETAIRRITKAFPGNYTFFLANESVLYVFSNFHPIMLLRESKTSGEVLLVTSVKEALSPQKWLLVKPEGPHAGRLLVIAGPDLLHSATVCAE